MVQTCTNCLINSSLKQFGAGVFTRFFNHEGLLEVEMLPRIPPNLLSHSIPVTGRRRRCCQRCSKRGADGQCANGYVKTNNSSNSRWFISSIICGGYDGDMMGIYPRIWGNRFDLDQHSWWWLVSKTGHETECRGTHMVQLIFRANSAKDLSPQDSMLPGPQVMNT